MWSVMFIMMVIIAIIFMILSFYYVEEENLVLASTFVLITTVFWFLLAAAVIEIEFPYTVIQSDNTIVDGVHTFGDSTAVSMLYVFLMMAMVQIVYGLGTIPFIAFKLFKERQEKIKEKRLKL